MNIYIYEYINMNMYIYIYILIYMGIVQSRVHYNVSQHCHCCHRFHSRHRCRRGTRETCQSGWTTSLANWKGLAFTVQGPLHGMWKP